ncbi:MAG: hypothetical protein RR894_13285 [Terrisporobacter sp.]
MVIINLMIITLFVCSIVLLSGVKIMFKSKYTQIIMFLFVTYNPLLNLIYGYKLGYTGISSIIIFIILFLSIFIWGYRKNKYTYSIHNVKQNDVINIIEMYLETKNIKYEIIEKDIYLPEFYKTIFVNGLIETNIDYRDIKDMNFHDELVAIVRVGIKETKRSKISIEGMFYLVFVGILYWIRTEFLVGFIK